MKDVAKIIEKSQHINLLYIEDDPLSRDFILEILQEFFPYTTVAVDGVDGLEKFKENEIDLIITDISMPKMNGFEMIEHIRKIDKDVPIVILSAYSEAEYFIKGIEYRVDGYLLKPFNLEQFLAILNNVINSIQLRQEIKKLNERMDMALDGGKTAVLDWNFSNNDFYISSCWKEMLGYKDDELQNKILTWKERLHREDRKSVFGSLKQVIAEKGRLYENIHRLKHRDGHWIWILGRSQIIYDENGKAIRMVGTHTDITEEKELQLKASYQAEMLEQIYDGIISTDLRGMIMGLNTATEELLGYKADEIIGKCSDILYLQEDIEIRNKELEILMMTGKHHITTRLVKKSGEVLYVDLTFILMRDDRGNLLGKTAYIQDISRRKEAEVAIREHHKYLQSIIDSVTDPIMVIKEDYTVALMNSVLREKLKDIKIADPEHPKCYELSHNRSTPCEGFGHLCPLKDVISTKEHMIMVHDHYNVNREKRYVEISATPLFDNERNCIGIIESARDITAHYDVRDELEEQKDVLFHQAHHDALTGLPNRILFHDRLEHGLERSIRKKSGLALFFMDLDHFKEINDSVGHAVGDEVLKLIAKRLSALLRKEDTLARLGGDEFTIIIEDLTHLQDASILARKILESLREPIVVKEHKLYLSGSIGVSLYPEDTKSAQDLLKFADIAMYKAKEDGRNSFRFYSAEMTEFILERVLMEKKLREALENKNFMVYYQPQINTKSNQLIGMEALVRWQHPTMGLVSPANFIPLAESMGLIVELDKFVMKTAMTQISIWYHEGLVPGVMALNISLKQLREDNFIETLENMLKETHCRAEWIELEVTEAQIMTDPEESIRILMQIHQLGIVISVDDFGTGYSSLSSLKRLPIKRLKIDSSLIQKLPGDKEDAVITRSVIALAQSLNLKVIAEGVETKEQKEFLVESECEDIQGYFYAKPMTNDDMGVFLSKRMHDNI